MSQPYYKRDFSNRLHALGDESESKFLEVTKRDGGNATKFGQNRPEIFMGKLPAFIRYMPDFEQHDRLVECMGIGKDATLKLKLDKLYALLQWDVIHPTYLFVWHSTKKRYTLQHIKEVRKACWASGEYGKFPEGHPLWFLKVNALDWEWTDDTT